MMRSAALLGVAILLPAVAGSAMDDTTIRTAVTEWLSDATAAEAAHGHISTWATGGVTDMSYLFSPCDWSSKCNSAAASFNDDIGGWDTSGVTRMDYMFVYASAFNQDISGWAVHNVENMDSMFYRALAFDQDLGWCVDVPRTVNGTGHTGPSEFCATSI